MIDATTPQAPLVKSESLPVQKQGTSPAIFITTIVITAIVFGALGYAGSSYFGNKGTNTPVTITPTVVATTTVTPVSSKNFTSKINGVSFTYPADWTASETIYGRYMTISKGDLKIEISQLIDGGGDICKFADSTEDFSAYVPTDYSYLGKNYVEVTMASGAKFRRFETEDRGVKIQHLCYRDPAGKFFSNGFMKDNLMIEFSFPNGISSADNAIVNEILASFVVTK